MRIVSLERKSLSAMLGAITCLFLTLPFALACGPLMREDCSHDSSYQYDYFEEVQGELAQLEKAMQVERSGKGLEPESTAHGTGYVDTLVRHAKLSCYFDNAYNATRSFQAAIQADPEHVTARVGLAKALLARGDPAAALRHLDYLVESGIQTANFVVVLYRRLSRKLLGQLSAEDDDTFFEWTCKVLREAARVANIAAFNSRHCDTIRHLEDRTLKSEEKVLRSFKEKKYAKIKRLLPPSFVKEFLYPWFDFLFRSYGTSNPRSNIPSINVGIMLSPLGQNEEFPASVEIRINRVYHRLEVVGDPVAEILNHGLSVAMSRVAQTPLIPTYSFPMRYMTDGSIQPHIDQKDNEISLSYQLLLEKSCPEKWPLYFIDANVTVIPGVKSPAVIDVTPEMVRATKQALLKDNQGVLYRGRELVHFRNKYGKPNCGLQQLVFAWRTIHDLHCVGE